MYLFLFNKKIIIFYWRCFLGVALFLSDAIVIEQNSLIRFVVPDFPGIIYFLGNIFRLRFLNQYDKGF